MRPQVCIAQYTLQKEGFDFSKSKTLPATQTLHTDFDGYIIIDVEQMLGLFIAFRSWLNFAKQGILTWAHDDRRKLHVNEFIESQNLKEH